MAAAKLVRQAFIDAKSCGYKLPLSKSSDSYKGKKFLGYSVIDISPSLIIDEINVKNLKLTNINNKIKFSQSPQQKITHNSFISNESNINTDIIANEDNTSALFRDSLFEEDLKVPPSLRDFSDEFDNMSQESSQIQFSE